jgi:Flp pilus assembly protein TadD
LNTDNPLHTDPVPNDLAKPISQAESAVGQGGPTRAESLGRSAVARFPRHSAAHNILGAAISKLGKNQEAAARFMQAVHCGPSDLSHVLTWLCSGSNKAIRRRGRDVVLCHASQVL